MSNVLNEFGLQLATRSELVASLTESMQSIYGADVNLDSSSPDGQFLNILVQMFLDYEDLLMQVYNSFDPDNTIGTILDQRVGINGIQRQAGTRTVTNITLDIYKALNLYGVDQFGEDVYTVSDAAGNQWQLINSITIPSAGIYALSFQSATPGRVYTIPNTINVPVSVVLGITSINNPTSYTTLGIDEESDYYLKIRRQKSVSLSSQGYLSGLIAALENISGITTVVVYENNTNSTDGDGTPSHSIWIIIGGTASDSSIANAIYKKRNAGCGMRGTHYYTIVQADGSSFTILWDVVTPETLFTKFTLTSIDGVTVPNVAGIQSGLVTSFTPGLYQRVNVNELATLIQDIDPNSLVTSPGFCKTVGGTYVNTILPSAKNNQFSVSVANIIILPILITSLHSVVTVVAGVVTTTLTMPHSSADEQFSTHGGYGAITYNKQSGVGSITSAGLYTFPGSSGSVVIRATDSLGNFIDCSITIT
jgi:hypothetical protein